MSDKSSTCLLVCQAPCLKKVSKKNKKLLALGGFMLVQADTSQTVTALKISAGHEEPPVNEEDAQFLGIGRLIMSRLLVRESKILC